MTETITREETQTEPSLDTAFFGVSLGGVIYVALYPGPGQEASYEGYRRVAVPVDDDHWYFEDGSWRNRCKITFPKCRSGEEILAGFAAASAEHGDYDVCDYGRLVQMLHVKINCTPEFAVGALCITPAPPPDPPFAIPDVVSGMPSVVRDIGILAMPAPPRSYPAGLKKLDFEKKHLKRTTFLRALQNNGLDGNSSSGCFEIWKTEHGISGEFFFYRRISDAFYHKTVDEALEVARGWWERCYGSDDEDDA